MEKCSLIFQVYSSSINESDVTLKDLDLIKGYKERFFEILGFINRDDNQLLIISQNLTQRLKQLDDYKQTFNVMTYLEVFLHGLPENVGKKYIFFF